MAGRCLICCVLIQVLLITVYGDIEIKCPNQNGTVGKPLHLICNVACSKNGTPREWKWGPQMKEAKEMMISTGTSYTFNLTIPSASVDHNGTFTFFVQMTTGAKTTHFNVIIADPPTTSPTTPPSTSLASKETNSETVTGENNRSYTQIIGLLCVCSLAVIAVLVLCHKKKILKPCIHKENSYMSNSEPCTCKNMTVNDEMITIHT